MVYKCKKDFVIFVLKMIIGLDNVKNRKYPRIACEILSKRYNKT